MTRAEALIRESADRMLIKAEHFTELAKGLALQCLTDPYAPDVEKKKRLALEHTLRAESFREAASMVRKGGAS